MFLYMYNSAGGTSFQQLPMKKVFVYFDNMAMCENTAQAVDFINSLPGITCNGHTVKLLDDLFSGKKDFHGCEIRSLATTGCGKSRIRIYDALADTLEKHQEEYQRRETLRHKRMEAGRTELMKRKAADLRSRMDDVMLARSGRYRVRMTVWQYTFDVQKDCFPECAVEEQFATDVEAGSALDAYACAIRQAMQKYDVVECVPVTDSRFCYEFLGTAE